MARTLATGVISGGPSYFAELLDTGTYAGPYKDKNLDDFTGVTTPDDHTVVFHLKKPHADFDHVAALPQTAPVPAAKDTGERYRNRPVSTGPYKIDQYVADKSVSLVRNPSWRPDGIRTALPDRIEVTIGPDAATADQALVAGQADLNASGTGLGDASRAKVLGDPTLKKNTARPKDLAIAQSLLQALTRVGIRASIAQYPVPKFYTDDAGKPAFVHSNGLGMILSVWGPDFPAASGFYPLLVDGRQILPSSNNNLAELDDAGVDGVLDQIAQTKDATAREALTSDLDHKVMATGALVPLLVDKLTLYRNPRLTNATVSPVYGGYDLAALGIVS